MQELTLSLYVLLGAVVVAAAVFLLTRRAGRLREEALAAYCAQNGYRLTSSKEPTVKTIRIEGGNWQLQSSMRAIVSSLDSGSSGWQRETEWICRSENPLRETFALQLSAGSTDLDRLPQWVRDAALGAMRLWLGDWARELSSVRTAFCEGGRTAVVFEQQAHAADAALEQMRVYLDQYRGALPLYLESSPAQLRLRLPDVLIDTAQEAEALLCLAKTLI